MIARSRAWLLTAAALALLDCAGEPGRLDAPRTAAGVELAPYAILEECFLLEAGEHIDYYFTSAAPVAFNFHYHDVNAVIMPIVRAQATQDSGVYTADRKQVYCFMWEASRQGSLLDYRIRSLPAR